MQKVQAVWFHLLWSSRKGKIHPGWHKASLWLPGATGVGGDCKKGIRELSGEMKTVLSLSGGAYTGVYICQNSSNSWRGVHFWYVNNTSIKLILKEEKV